jgi:phosphoadenosine phosphosulfate reductase
LKRPSPISPNDCQAAEALTPAVARTLDARLSQLTTEEMLVWTWNRFGPRAAIGTGLEGAGLVLVHIARTNRLNFPVFTLDTGVWLPETQALKERLEQFFGFAIECVEPHLHHKHTPPPANARRRSPDRACPSRTVLPLRDKLNQLDCWVTGFRRQQSDTRLGSGVLELYPLGESGGREILKLSPMLNWTREAIRVYLREHQIPQLHLAARGGRAHRSPPCIRPSGSGPAPTPAAWTEGKKTAGSASEDGPGKINFRI